MIVNWGIIDLISELIIELVFLYIKQGHLMKPYFLLSSSVSDVAGDATACYTCYYIYMYRRLN